MALLCTPSLASDLPKMADSEAIKRAVANLVDNAAEAIAGFRGARD
jgi:nitrogen fixation/metabolism regulation signal transduction histidine kinase